MTPRTIIGTRALALALAGSAAAPMHAQPTSYQTSASASARGGSCGGPDVLVPPSGQPGTGTAFASQTCAAFASNATGQAIARNNTLSARAFGSVTAAPLLDCAVSSGGNAFYTAHVQSSYLPGTHNGQNVRMRVRTTLLGAATATACSQDVQGSYNVFAQMRADDQLPRTESTVVNCLGTTGTVNYGTTETDVFATLGGPMTLTGRLNLGGHGGTWHNTHSAYSLSPHTFRWDGVQSVTVVATGEQLNVSDFHLIDGNGFDWAHPPAPCAADFNGNLSLSVQDIFDFLAAYFAGDLFADINASNTLTVQDIFDFLAGYFTGCS